MDPVYIAVVLAIVLVSLTIHEAAHAVTANQLGDSTARLLGRISLNPIVHIDPIGTILLPLLAAASGLPILGWAKPVPVNMSRLRDPRRDFMIIAAAGPASNILLGVLGSLIYGVLPAAGLAIAGVEVSAVLRLFIGINIWLAVFNLVPVPPLDGGNVLAGLLPSDAALVFDRLRPYGFLILYALLFTGILRQMIGPPANFLMRLLVP